MQTRQKLLSALVLIVLVAGFLTARALGASEDTVQLQKSSNPHDGQHDFDFEIGTWKIHLKRLLHPLTGSTTWTEFDGTSITRKLWNGRANIEQFETTGAGNHIEGLTLRLYNSESHQWSIYWAASKDGVLGIPTIGEFKNGQGEFYDQEPYSGRAILVRYIWSQITPTSAHFEQSFSDNGGKTWEVNWITDQNRISEEEFKAASESSSPKLEAPSGQAIDHQHDFDFEFGTWRAQLKRLAHPLSGSDEWVEYDGTSIVSKLWNGRANLGELSVEGPSGHIEGITLRIYNSQSHQWRLYWANSKDAALQVPTIGQFDKDRGEFFDQEEFQGKSIFVRFLFSDVTSSSFRTEQAFSPDGGKSWEPNWTATFTRAKQ